LRTSFFVYLNLVIPKETIICAEIGVAKGENAVEMLKNYELLKLYGVDPYPSGNEDERNEMFKNLKPFGTRYQYLNKTSEEASSHFPDEFFDYVYIDGDHSYENVLKDLHYWYPKVKVGGMIAGHDAWYVDVAKAIRAFTQTLKIQGFTTVMLKDEVAFSDEAIFMDWWINKRGILA